MIGFLDGITQGQVKLDLRMQMGDEDMESETVLEKALHLEAVTRIEEEEQTTKIAVFRQDLTKGLVEAVTKLVNQLSEDDKPREIRRRQSRERGPWGYNRPDRKKKQDREFSDRRRPPTPGPSHRDKNFGRDERLGETTYRFSRETH